MHIEKREKRKKKKKIKANAIDKIPVSHCWFVLYSMYNNHTGLVFVLLNNFLEVTHRDRDKTNASAEHF